MKTHQYYNVEKFLDKVEPVLIKKEVVNNLPLGILYTLVKEPDTFGADSRPFLATVEEHGEVKFVMVMTPKKNIIIYGAGKQHSSAIETAISYLTENHIHVPGVIGPRNLAEQFAEKWAQYKSINPIINMEQRIYKLGKVHEIRRSPGLIRSATKADLPIVSGWVQQFSKAAMEPMTEEEAYNHAEKTIDEGTLYLWEDGGRPVSMAKQARPTKNGTVVSLVYTPPELQKKGYATTCVAELSQLLLDKGYKFCSLYTDLANPTSNGIYMKIGYQPVEDSIVYHF